MNFITSFMFKKLNKCDKIHFMSNIIINHEYSCALLWMLPVRDVARAYPASSHIKLTKIHICSSAVAYFSGINVSL